MKKAGHRNGFTLVELMVVIGVILILVSIIVPTIGSAKKAALRTKAQSDIKMLHSAISAFKNEYNRYPLCTTAADMANDKEYDNARLVDTLCADDSVDNPRGIPFLEPNAASMDDGEFVDPFGEAYNAMVDSDYDGRIQVNLNDPVHNVSIGVISNHSIAVWSLGDQNDKRDDMGPFTSWGGEFSDN